MKLPRVRRVWAFLLALAVGCSLFVPATAIAEPSAPPAIVLADPAPIVLPAPALVSTPVPTRVVRLDAATPKFNPYRCGNNTKRVLLVFDDYPVSSASYKALVRQAAKSGIGIGIAPNGKYVRSGKVDVKYARDRGMYVIDHGYDHYDMTTLSRAKIRWEITRKYIGSNYVRPPYGAHNAKVDDVFKSEHKRRCLWNLDPQDWASGVTPTKAANTIIRTARPGSVAVVHLQHLGKNAKLLPKIKSGLARRGIKLCRPYRVNGKVAASPSHLPASLPC